MTPSNLQSDSSKTGSLSPATLLAERMREVFACARKAARSKPHTEQCKKAVHRLRVSTRRADTALRTLTHNPETKVVKTWRSRLKQLRRAASLVRAAHVTAARLLTATTSSHPEHRIALEAAAQIILQNTTDDVQAMRRTANDFCKRKSRKTAKALLKNADIYSDLTRARAAALPRILTKLFTELQNVEPTFESLHSFRVKVKRAKYACEIFQPCMGVVASAIVKELGTWQDELGSINDDRDLAKTLRALATRLASSAEVIHDSGADNAAPSDSQLAHALMAVSDGVLAQAKIRMADWWRTRSEREKRLLEITSAASSIEQNRSENEDQHLRTEHASAETTDTDHQRATAESHIKEPSEQRPLQPGERMAVLDVGTNSIRLVIAEALNEGSYRVLDDEKAVTRLGRGLARDRVLSEQSMRQSIEAIARMKSIAAGYGVRAFQAVGTSAVREALNRDEFLDRLMRETGVKLEVISSEEEGRLAHVSVAAAFELQATTAAVVDIGGGSVEVALSNHGVIQDIRSMPLGAVRMTERFGLHEDRANSNLEVRLRRFKRMQGYIKQTIRRTLRRIALAPQMLVGTGGTFTALAALALNKLREDEGSSIAGSKIRGYELDRATIRHVLDSLLRMTLKERSRLAGLNSDRADIIIAGAAVVDAILQHLHLNSIRVHDRGIRDGMLLKMIHNDHRQTDVSHGAMKSVREFAHVCNYERDHSEHVTKLALQIYDQLPDAIGHAWAGPESRRLLEAAAVLHDIGYFINYSKHHKHSYHLIMHSDLSHWSHRDLEIIANVARYHRRAAPAKSHENWASLAKPARALVCQLAGILRIADGLDRSHAQLVKQIRLRSIDGTLAVEAIADIEPRVDIWGSERKAALFERAFNKPVRIEWHASLGNQLSEIPSPGLFAPSVE